MVKLQSSTRGIFPCLRAQPGQLFRGRNGGVQNQPRRVEFFATSILPAKRINGHNGVHVAKSRRHVLIGFFENQEMDPNKAARIMGKTVEYFTANQNMFRIL